jgi:hypothetical protein
MNGSVVRLFDVLEIARSSRDARIFAYTAFEIGIHLRAECRLAVAEEMIVDVPAKKAVLLPFRHQDDSTGWHGERYATRLWRKGRASRARDISDPCKCICDSHAAEFSSKSREHLVESP